MAQSAEHEHERIEHPPADPPGLFDDEHVPGGPSPEAKAAAEPAKQALHDALLEIKTPEQAEHVAEELMSIPAQVKERDIREEGGAAPEPAQAIQEAAATTPGTEKAPATLVETAKQIAGSTGETREALEQAVQEVTNPEREGAVDPELQASRDMLLEAILPRMKPLQALDTRAFLAINHLPHPLAVNWFMYTLTVIMNGGWGWIMGLLAASMVDKKRGLHALHQVVPPLWFATMTVEYPIKYYFRRRRPFIDIIQAIAVGRKPGTYSFPSGHSAAAFAGAWLLRRHYPELTGVWYAIAALVAFSRIYLGAHYPGDVLSGAVSGTVIAEATRWVIDHADTPPARHPVARRLREWFD